MKKHYDVCIAGFWYGSNYGSLLNGYAMYRVLKDYGKEVLMLQKPGAAAEDQEIKSGHNVNFVQKYYDPEDISPALPYSDLSKLNDICDCFCAGSDQIWNYNLSFHENLYLPFVNKEKKLISFSTSFGHKRDKTPVEAMGRIREYLQRYSAISVREQFDVDILRDNYGINAKLLFEPVFCIDKSYYTELASHAKFEEKEPYLLTYILDPTPEKREAIKYYGEKSGLKVVNILNGVEYAWERNKELLGLPNIVENVEAEDFLKAFMNAEYVITDSFHGSAFSIIFNKPFLAIGNHGRGFERFIDLLGRLELMDRLVDDPKNIPHDEKYLESFSYEKTNQIIQKEAENTIQWVKNAIDKPIEQIPSILIENFKESELERLEKEKVETLYKNPDFQKIRMLATLLRDYKVKHVVLSPGGRDVPIVRMFEYNEKSFVLHRIVDERSAAYYGLGLAVQLQEPVACVCTSGTAASNYLPAVTEAYFTGVPLIMITADRYEVYHGQGEDQTIPQKNIFADVIKKEITVPEGDGYNVMYQARRDISDCILEATHNGFGPVHINIGIGNIHAGANVNRESWQLLPRINPHILRVGLNDGDEQLRRWVAEMKKVNKILIVYGQNPPANESQIKNIEKFAEKYNCVIVTDYISNLNCKHCLKPYNMLKAISSKEFDERLAPNILITVGGKQLMNDPLTYRIRGSKRGIRHWSVMPNGKIKDFYFRLSSVLEMSQDKFFEWFADNAGDIRNNNEYYNTWETLTKQYPSPSINGFNSNFVQSRFLPSIPSDSMLHLGVGQSFIDCRKYEIDKSVNVFCNMGTNGIDGCTSTFMGQCAAAKEKLCFLLVGDLSFFYDMNSIWNKPLNNKMRILLVNNRGSGLLRGNKLRAITSSHNASAEGWVKNCGFKYISADNEDDFEKLLKWFVSEEPNAPVFFEVFCQ